VSLNFHDILESFGAFRLPAYATCFGKLTEAPELDGEECKVNEECALDQFCMSCDTCFSKNPYSESMSKLRDWATKKLNGTKLPFAEKLDGNCQGCSPSKSVCRKRAACKEGLPVSGQCPTALTEWQWTMDPSVHPLTKGEAQLLAPHGHNEAQGGGFELVSPPLSGKEGIRSALEVMSVLRRMGIQAGVSSGMHVHVNVASMKVPGKLLSPRQIANVWVAFTKFQLVIDEFFSPSRLGNHYARRLFLGECSLYDVSEACSPTQPCTCARRFFKQIHEYVLEPRTALDSLSPNYAADFCNAALRMPGDDKPCNKRYPEQRYYSLNLVPLARLGTIEFRAHSATYDLERLQRWIEFVVAFVEHFGDRTNFYKNFFDGTANDDLKELRQAQETATAADLFAALHGKINDDTAAYFSDRSWEDDAPGCNIEAAPSESQDEALDKFETAHLAAQLFDGQVSVKADHGE